MTILKYFSFSGGLTKFAFVKFESPAQALKALTLNNSTLLGTPIIIVLASSDYVSTGSSEPNSPTAAAAGILPLPNLANLTPAAAAALLLPPTNAMTNAEKADEVARTVYVGNVNSQVKHYPINQFYVVTRNLNVNVNEHSFLDNTRTADGLFCKLWTDHLLQNGGR